MSMKALIKTKWDRYIQIETEIEAEIEIHLHIPAMEYYSALEEGNPVICSYMNAPQGH